jgi:LysR family glycine cleavage system transcriptional activator
MAEKKLAHLNALRAFEAAVRHMSFAKAAAELSVTPGAISQQIKLLESYYGVQLFRRGSRGIALTEDGARMVPELTAAFDLLARATSLLQSRNTRAVVRVTAPPTFAVKWLAHRLGNFAIEHRDIEVRIESTERLIDLRREEGDLGIRYGRGSWPGMIAELLLGEQIVPVCSPAYLAAHPVKSVEDLAKATLIHDRTLDQKGLNFPDWSSWLRGFGVTAPEQGALHFSSSLAAIQAAVDGFGIILGRSTLIEDELKDGSLVMPLDHATDPGSAYYLVTPDTAALSEAASIFQDWLRKEAASAHTSELPSRTANVTTNSTAALPGKLTDDVAERA